MLKIINVLDHEIKVFIDDPTDWSMGMGMANPSTGVIRLSRSLSPDMLQSTFLHELIHCIADMNSIELTEQTIDGLALAFNSFLKSNPCWNVNHMEEAR